VAVNVWEKNSDYGRLIDFVRKSSPDILVLEEICQRWDEPLAALKSELPFWSSLAEDGHFGVAIFSRFPLDELRIELFHDRVPVIVARITIDQTPITIYGVHLAGPMSAAGTTRQTQELSELANILMNVSTDQIVLGDFNSTSWAPAFSSFVSQTRLRDTRLGFGIQPSWPSFLPEALRISIDHCLVSAHLHVIRRQLGPDVGSDHLPIIVDLETRQKTRSRRIARFD
jgi:endonuclease/exonuclease/phosphatase (EEP) superfamily protein YafD